MDFENDGEPATSLQLQKTEVLDMSRVVAPRGQGRVVERTVRMRKESNELSGHE